MHADNLTVNLESVSRFSISKNNTDGMFLMSIKTLFSLLHSMCKFSEPLYSHLFPSLVASLQANSLPTDNCLQLVTQLHVFTLWLIHFLLIELFYFT